MATLQSAPSWNDPYGFGVTLKPVPASMEISRAPTSARRQLDFWEGDPVTASNRRNEEGCAGCTRGMLRALTGAAADGARRVAALLLPRRCSQPTSPSNFGGIGSPFGSAAAAAAVTDYTVSNSCLDVTPQHRHQHRGHPFRAFRHPFRPTGGGGGGSGLRLHHNPFTAADVAMANAPATRLSHVSGGGGTGGGSGGVGGGGSDGGSDVVPDWRLKGYTLTPGRCSFNGSEALGEDEGATQSPIGGGGGGVVFVDVPLPAAVVATGSSKSGSGSGSTSPTGSDNSRGDGFSCASSGDGCSGGDRAAAGVDGAGAGADSGPTRSGHSNSSSRSSGSSRSSCSSCASSASQCGSPHDEIFTPPPGLSAASVSRGSSCGGGAPATVTTTTTIIPDTAATGVQGSKAGAGGIPIVASSSSSSVAAATAAAAPPPKSRPPQLMLPDRQKLAAAAAAGGLVAPDGRAGEKSDGGGKEDERWPLLSQAGKSAVLTC